MARTRSEVVALGAVTRLAAAVALLLVGVTFPTSCLSFSVERSTTVLYGSGRSSALYSEPPQPSTPQSGYGTTSDLPDTYVRCGRCETIYALTENDLTTGGNRPGRGRRLECTVCGHSWFQSRDRIMNLRDGFEMIPLPDEDKERIETNIAEGKKPKFVGDMKLYVGNIAFECHEDDIAAVFANAGYPVGDVSLVRDEEGRNRGFGFVTMRTKDDGLKAMGELDGSSVRGRRIAVRESNN